MRRALPALLAAGLLCACAGAPAPLDRKVPDWLAPEDPARDARLETALILEAIDPRPGEAIADIGAGGGYFTFKLARLVGAGGRVIATDTDQGFVDGIRAYAAAHGLSNVTALAVRLDDPGLGAPVDKIVIVNLFYFDSAARARAYLGKLGGLLRAGGRLVLYQDESGCPSADRGPSWGGCMLSGAELARAAEGPFEEARPVTLPENKQRQGGYLLVLRRRP